MVAAYGENYVWLNDSVTLDGYEGSENETAPERRRGLTAIDTIEIYGKTSDATEFFLTVSTSLCLVGLSNSIRSARLHRCTP